jgi:2-desacetyl-2-hydroxyethyl bacteriochlorophyllide A dehydrogenase
VKAVVIPEKDTIEVTSVPDPAPGPREVVLQVAGCGICGTDLHILQGEFAPTLPIVPGHEFAGEVVAAGRDVRELSVGDHVAVDPSLFCGECYQCRLGRFNLCERWRAIGVTDSGGAAEFAVAPAANCVRLPEGVRPADAALIEPLSRAVRALDILRMGLAAHVLIYGSGTMGLMILQLAKRAGATTVSLVDINPERLVTARRLGCTAAVKSADELERARGWDVVVDCTGVVAAIEDGLGRVAKGGTFLQFGVTDYAARVQIEPYRIYNREITITGRWRCCTPTSVPPSSSSTGWSTLTCSSATACRWTPTTRRSTGCAAASGARSRSCPARRRDAPARRPLTPRLLARLVPVGLFRAKPVVEADHAVHARGVVAHPLRRLVVRDGAPELGDAAVDLDRDVLRRHRRIACDLLRDLLLERAVVGRRALGRRRLRHGRGGDRAGLARVDRPGRRRTGRGGGRRLRDRRGRAGGGGRGRIRDDAVAGLHRGGGHRRHDGRPHGGLARPPAPSPTRERSGRGGHRPEEQDQGPSHVERRYPGGAALEPRRHEPVRSLTTHLVSHSTRG